MSKTILLAYATKYGSTLEVAEKLVEVLKSQGLNVDLQPARKVRTLEGYDAVVLGAPLLLFKWHKDAMNFLSRQHKALSQLPVAIFALGPSFKGDEGEWKGARKQLDRELVKFTWLKPAVVELFGGKFDPEKMNFFFKSTMRDIPAGDLRDWKAIEKWGANLADILFKASQE
jgi:menaquinone-dependent protoporphyrinogen oxidase